MCLCIFTDYYYSFREASSTFLLGFSFSFQSVFLVSILFLLFENVCSLY